VKKILFILIGLVITLNSFGQEPSEQIKLVIIDSSGNIIAPDIWVRSKRIHQESLSVMESKQEHLIIDSLPKFQNGAITFYNQSYTIYPIIGGHWLDSEYSIKLFFRDKVMNINLITDGSSFSDTITFKEGDFVYLGNNIGSLESLQRGIHVRHKLIEIASDKDHHFCSLNCGGIINMLDTALESILLKTNNYFPEFLIVNNLPVGVLIWNERHLYVCYFSDDYLKLLKNNYY